MVKEEVESPRLVCSASIASITFGAGAPTTPSSPPVPAGTGPLGQWRWGVEGR